MFLHRCYLYTNQKDIIRCRGGQEKIGSGHYGGIQRQASGKTKTMRSSWEGLHLTNLLRKNRIFRGNKQPDCNGNSSNMHYRIILKKQKQMRSWRWLGNESACHTSMRTEFASPPPVVKRWHASIYLWL